MPQKNEIEINKAKEKAIELYNKFDQMDFHDCADHDESAKECAIISVDIILENDCGYNAYDGVIGNEMWIDTEYWNKVKEEIQKL